MTFYCIIQLFILFILFILFNNGLIIQFFIGYAANGATGAYVTMPISFSNNRYTLVQAYYTSEHFMSYAMCPTWNYVASTGSQCFLGVYNLQQQFWSKVIAIGF